MSEQEAIEYMKNWNKDLSLFDDEKEGINCHNLAISALEEIQQYRAIGDIKHCRAYKEIAELYFKKGVQDMKCLYELSEYRAIGTVEECRDAVEKQKGKKPNIRQTGGDNLKRRILFCPTCDRKLYDCVFKNGKLDHVSPGSRKSHFCDYCGQKLDWT